MNNVYVSSFNHGFDPNVYIDAIPADRVVQYHLAGHTNKGTHIVDTHSDHAIPEVWELYRRAWRRTGPDGDALRVGRGHPRVRGRARRGPEGARVSADARRAALETGTHGA